LEIYSVAKIGMFKPGIYKHYKGGEYKVEGIAKHSETREEMIVYRALYGDFGLWVRPRVMFEEDVEVDGVMMPRFKLIQEIKNG